MHLRFDFVVGNHVTQIFILSLYTHSRLGHNTNFTFINIFNLYYLVWADNDKNNVDLLIRFLSTSSPIVKKKESTVQFFGWDMPAENHSGYFQDLKLDICFHEYN